MVRYLGLEMSTSSLALYTSSAAVLLQALVLICFSSFADHGKYSHSLSCFTATKECFLTRFNRAIPKEYAHVYILHWVAGELSVPLRFAISVLRRACPGHHGRRVSRMFICLAKRLFAIACCQSSRQPRG